MSSDEVSDIRERLAALETRQEITDDDVKELKADRKKVLIGFGMMAFGVAYQLVGTKLGL